MIAKVWEVHKAITDALEEIQSEEYRAELAKKEADFLRRKKIEEDEAARAAAKEASKRTWTKEDMAMLSKACNKFPGGSMNRWETIADYVSVQLRLKEPLTKEECLNMSQLA